jgi:hypothetical protein
MVDVRPLSEATAFKRFTADALALIEERAVPGPEGKPGIPGPPGQPGTSTVNGVGVPYIPVSGDNAAGINAILNTTGVAGVILPAGDIRLDHAIVVPSGKFVRGAGIDVTRLIRTNNLDAAEFSDKAIVRFATGAAGCYAADYTGIAPKTSHKVQCVWMFTNKHCLAERIKAVNMGYAFFAQEFSQFCAFRDIQSFNANVHFETTAAYDILFENTYARDGDGDNPLGFEGVWHTLFGSKRITFRNGDHVGKGTPFLVVADSGSGDAGFVDDIRFENCRSVCTTAVNAIQVSKINASASVGKITMFNCALVAPGLACNLEQGQLEWIGGKLSTTSQEVFVQGTGTMLLTRNLDVTVNAPAGTTGFVYNNNAAPLSVYGGSITTSTGSIYVGGGANSYISPSTRYVSPNKIYAPSIGQTLSYVYAQDVPRGGDGIIGQGTPQPQLRFVAGFPGSAVGSTRYRIRLAGKFKRAVGDGSISMGIGVFNKETTSGLLTYETGDDIWTTQINGYFGNPGIFMPNQPEGTVRSFVLDIEAPGFDGEIFISMGNDGIVLMAGAHLTIERLL